MKTDAKNVSALCHAFDLGKAEGLRVAKEKYLDADAYNEGIADGRESAIDEYKKKIEFEYKWLLDCKVFEPNVGIAFNTLISYADQMKEQNNEGNTQTEN